jgi:hypothetical protein
MELWMRLGQPLEALLGNHERAFDAWEDGGVRGVVIGRMVFMPDVGSGTQAEAIPAFAPNPAIYRALGVAAPAPPDQLFPEKRRQLDQLLGAARARGWPVLIFEPAAFRGAGGSGSGNAMLDDVTRSAYFARAEDTLSAFPQVDGAIIDGPEWPYEIAPGHDSAGPYESVHGHRHFMFADLPAPAEARAAELGYDFEALTRTHRGLLDRLHALDERAIGEFATGGLRGGLGLIGYDASVVDWVRFRIETLTSFVQALRGHLDGIGRPIKLGMGPRTASLAPLAGYDFGRLASILDYLLPKDYYWHRGYDGMYGTTARYVQTLVDWNPGLSER